MPATVQKVTKGKHVSLRSMSVFSQTADMARALNCWGHIAASASPVGQVMAVILAMTTAPTTCVQTMLCASTLIYRTVVTVKLGGRGSTATIVETTVCSRA